MRYRLLFTSARLSNDASFHFYPWQNSVAHRGPVLWNALIFKDKNFSNISYKDLKRKTRSMEIFKELTFKETSTTTINFRRKDFNLYLGDLESLMMYTYSLVRVFNN